MSTNLLQELNEKTGTSLAKHSSDFLGEDIAETNSAVSGTYATLIASLIETGSQENGASKLMKMVKKADPDVLDSVDRIFTRSPQTVNGLVNTGTRDLPTFMGRNREASNLIAKESGIKKESSAKLMRLSTPFLMSILGKHVADKNLDANGLLDLVKGQKSHVESRMPGGMVDALQLSSMGWKKKEVVKKEAKKKVKKDPAEKEKMRLEREEKKAAKAAEMKAKATPEPVAVADTGGGIGGLLKWLVPFLVAAGLIWFLLTRFACGTEIPNPVQAVVAKTETAVAAVKEKTVNAMGAVNDTALKALDNIKFGAGSAGAQMLAFVKGGAKGEGKFVFKNLNFASGSANIAGTSGVEVDNLAQILKAYTDVKISVTGYTDSQGKAASNKALSERRAKAVFNQLVAQGIDAGRITTQGMGAENPVATNETAEGRAQNRRIEVVIVK